VSASSSTLREQCDNLHASNVAQLYLALAAVHHENATENHDQSQKDRHPVETKRRPDSSGVVAVENENASDDSVESDGDRTKKTGLREVMHDVDGYFRIEEEAEKAHDCEESEEHDAENLV
jgi:hypothetical protein